MSLKQKIKNVLILILEMFVLDSLSPFIRKIRMKFGIILVLIGVILLLQNTGVLEPGIWRIVWPLIIIIIGLFLVLRPGEWKNGRHCPWFFWRGRNKDTE